MRQQGLLESLVWRNRAAGWFLYGPFQASLSEDGKSVSVPLEEGGSPSSLRPSTLAGVPQGASCPWTGGTRRGVGCSRPPPGL